MSSSLALHTGTGVVISPNRFDHAAVDLGFYFFQLFPEKFDCISYTFEVGLSRNLDIPEGQLFLVDRSEFTLYCYTDLGIVEHSHCY